ncbi:protein Largen [Electrophorus electricus]|uniref:protein Largen n=1 Tax=Electrophorus electricus TaxID=8005 RepID=UPI0015D0657D|nr:protein Largen [Electrophorus electricus]
MSGTTHVESEGVSKVQVKRQIKTIVEDLENILGDLKEVAKELKEVVHEIDSLTSDLQLEEEMADSSKTDTLNSSSSSTTTTTTASSIDKIKVYPEDASIRPPAINPGLLTVLKRPHLPLPPPLRLMSSRSEDHSKGLSSGSLTKANGTFMRNGGFPTKPINVPGRDLARGPKSMMEKLPPPMSLLRHEKNRCPQVTRERVRFSETVQYHGYCPDCDLQYDMSNTDVHLHAELISAKLSPVHQCSSLSPTHVLLENGSLSLSQSFPPSTPPCVPHHLTQKPQKTILRKSTTTTV